MKIGSKSLEKLISESIKKHLIKEWGNTLDYPGDSDFRSDAPWNQSDLEIKEEPCENVFPTIPFLIYGFSEFVDECDRCIEYLNTNQIKWPSTIYLTANCVRELGGWEEPDEEGYSYRNPDDVRYEDADILFKINGKYVSLVDWSNKFVRPINKELAIGVEEIYNSIIELIENYEYDNIVREIAQWIKQNNGK